jgi:hypothetical protein
MGVSWDGFGAWVSAVVSTAEAFFGNVGVDLRGGEGGVAEQGLHTAEVSAGIEQVGGKGMAQFVWRNRKGYRRLTEIFFQQQINGLLGNASAA